VGKTGLYVAMGDDELRWQLKQAALDNRQTIRELVIHVLCEWLQSHGYRRKSASADTIVHADR